MKGFWKAFVIYSLAVIVLGLITLIGDKSFEQWLNSLQAQMIGCILFAVIWIIVDKKSVKVEPLYLKRRPSQMNFISLNFYRRKIKNITQQNGCDAKFTDSI